MPVITAIKTQKKRQRFNIYLDGKFSFALSAIALAKADLKVDQEISEKEIKVLKAKDVKDKLYDQALRFLSYRPRSEKEIRDYLVKKGANQKINRAIIAKLKKQNLINDQAFTQWWIDQRSRFRSKGKWALLMELLQKGIKKEVIEASLFSDQQELVLAKKAARKKMKAYHNLESVERRQKMTGFLNRRGFSWETIKKALEEISKKR